MLARADAALVIGDPAIDIDRRARSAFARSISAREWNALTGLPFVYAMWIGAAGRGVAGAVPARCRHAREQGVANLVRIATQRRRAAMPAGPTGRWRYLRDNLKYGLGEREAAGSAALPRAGASRLGVVPALKPLRFYLIDDGPQGVRAANRSGGRLTADEALQLYRQAPTYWLGRMADGGARAASIPRASSPTSSIATSTTPTSAWRAATSARSIAKSGTAKATCSASTRSSRRSKRRVALGGEQMLLQGGHNPDLPLEWYEDLLRAREAAVPGLQAARASPPEVLHISRTVASCRCRT